MENIEIEVENQGNTIQNFGLDLDGKHFLLTSKQTYCLAKDQCGIPVEKQKVKLSDLNDGSCFSPDENCC